MIQKKRKLRIPPAVWYLLPALLLAGCAADPGFEDIDVTRAAELMAKTRDNPTISVIDVRSPREYAAGRLPGAVNVSIHDPGFRRNLESLDRAKTYLVYCNVGTRSRRASGLMGELGFRKVYHLPAGIRGWQAQRQAIER